MNSANDPGASAVAAATPVRGRSRSMRVEPLTCAIGAELHGLDLADAVHDDALFAGRCAPGPGGRDRCRPPGGLPRRSRTAPGGCPAPWHCDTTWRECPQMLERAGIVGDKPY
jgi:hypothetical protein